MKRLCFCSNETQQSCTFIFKTAWKLHFKNNEKIPGNCQKPGNIMEFFQSGKMGTLNWAQYSREQYQGARKESLTIPSHQ